MDTLSILPLQSKKNRFPLQPDLSDQFQPDADLSGEYEVENPLDHRQRGRSVEYLVKWRGYDTFEATWEPASNLTNCLCILASYRQRRGLR